VLGAFSHLLWDSLTHHDGWIVQMFPVLNSPVFVFPQGTMRVYYILQYAGSLAGIVIMVYWYLKWYWQAEPLSTLFLTDQIREEDCHGFGIGSFTFVEGLGMVFLRFLI
jgi:hypothetical protein